MAGAGSLTAAAPAGVQPRDGRVTGGPASHAADEGVDGPRSAAIASAPGRASAGGSGTRGAAADESPAVAGRVAQYAWGRDYHKLLRARLRSLVRRLAEHYPGERFRTGVDATPLLEAHHAVAAGVGFRGKHTLAINGEHGSWFFIGEVLTTLAIAPTPTPTSARARKRCGSGCSYCIDVCPTSAIVAPYQLDARRCISYLTIEHRGPVAEELREAIGDWLFGCDLCQEVCPWTVRARATAEPDLLHWRAGDALELATLLELRTHADVVARFAGSPLMRAGRDRLVRNACTVAGNRGAVELLPQLRRLTRDRDRGVAEHARWAVQRITGAAEPPATGRRIVNETPAPAAAVSDPDRDTIVAIATPPGAGALAIVRLSGAGALAMADAVFRGRASLREAATHTAHYGEVVRRTDGAPGGSEVIDDVVATVFRSPASFTGEDAVEITCHGSGLVAATIVEALLNEGARGAAPGELPAAHS